jgi:hypothetical protein
MLVMIFGLVKIKNQNGIKAIQKWLEKKYKNFW